MRRAKSAAGSALLLTNIHQLVTLRGTPGPRRGRELGDLAVLEDAAVLCDAGRITSVGTRREALRDSWYQTNRKKVHEVDCRGGVVLPGFVDSHTHPAFTAPRLVDFEKRIGGATYEQIAEAGGGIRSSVEGVRKATRSDLAQHVRRALQEMVATGTTTVEAKSGYGLSPEAEIKSLQAIRDAARRWAGTVVSTLLGAHVVPREYAGRPDEYVRIVCEKMIPRVAKSKLAEFVDVFCDRGAFSEAETEIVFQAAVARGLGVRAHMCQLSTTAVGPILEKFSPASLDHMDYVSDEDMAALARRDTIVTLLPGANYFLGLERYASARKLIEAGVPVALATDYNPGTSPTVSMPMVLSLACTHMKMSAAEAISAATINGAWALRLQSRKGSVEPGKDADLSIFDVRDYREIPYWFGSNRCSGVVLGGQYQQPCSPTA